MKERCIGRRNKEHTARGLLCTISAACWLVKCSQSPSDAKITNLSFSCRTLVYKDGSAVSTGRVRG